MKLSIIIPIFGVERYIEKCLLSCVDQDLSDDSYEIICINDGTPDNSAIIARKIASRYHHVSVVDQTNQGLSMARNNGLELAKGDYVWFVDSDDYIEKNCLGRIVSKLNTGIDILQLQFRHVYEDSTECINYDSFIIEGTQPGYQVLLNGGLPEPAQFCIYRRQFLLDNDLRFVKGIYHEDSEFKPRAIYLAKAIASDNEVCYNYLQRSQGNIMASFSVKRAKDIITVNNSLYSFSGKVSRACKPAFYSYIGMNFNSLFIGYRKLSQDDKANVRHMLNGNKHLFRSMCKSGKPIYIVEGLLFKINIQLGLYLHSLVR